MVNKILCRTRIKLRTVYSVGNVMVVEISHLDNISRIGRAKIYVRLRFQAPVDGYESFSNFWVVALPLELDLIFLGGAKLFRILSLFAFLYSAIASEVFDHQGVGEFNNIELCFRDVDWWKKGGGG